MEIGDGDEDFSFNPTYCFFVLSRYVHALLDTRTKLLHQFLPSQNEMKMKIITTHVIHPFSGENYFFFSFSRDFFFKKIEIICIIQAGSLQLFYTYVSRLSYSTYT